MRQTLSRGAFAAAAATGVLSLYGAPAFADTHAEGVAEGSPGVLSGNNVQAPVEVPVNVCGNAIGVASMLNEASDNTCVNGSQGGGGSDQRTSGISRERSGGGGASAEGVAEGSPGVLSGNVVQVPVHVPVNVCGNSVNVVGLLNSAHDNTCVNGYSPDKSGEKPEAEKPHTWPDHPHTQPDHPHNPPRHEIHTPPPAAGEEPPHLAETGSDSVLAASAAAASLLVGGTLLYRRGRAARR